MPDWGTWLENLALRADGYSSRIENVMLCLGALETVLSDMGRKVEFGTAEAAAHYAYAANPLPLPVASEASAKAA